MSSVLVVAGESSGDKHAARLVEEFRKTHPDVSFFGVGGPRLEAAGVEVLVPMTDLAVMGLFEVVSRLRRIRAIFQRLRREARARKPSAAVLVDSPDFNLRLARKLKRLGVPVLYYISPTVWAWRAGRLKTIRRNVAEMLLIFPFEEKIYAEARIPAVYVGHPLVESVRAASTRAEFLTRNGFDPRKRLVTILPGSREGEVRRHLPALLGAIPLLREAYGAQFAVIASEGLPQGALEGPLAGHPDDLKVLTTGGYEAMAAADLVLSACGTANLEAALLGTPLVAFYRISPLTFALGKRLVKISHYSIVNILAGRPIVAELIQNRLTPENLLSESRAILDSPQRRDALKAEFRSIAGQLGHRTASVNAAKELEKIIDRE